MLTRILHNSDRLYSFGQRLVANEIVCAWVTAVPSITSPTFSMISVGWFKNSLTL